MLVVSMMKLWGGVVGREARSCRCSLFVASRCWSPPTGQGARAEGVLTWRLGCGRAGSGRDIETDMEELAGLSASLRRSGRGARGTQTDIEGFATMGSRLKLKLTTQRAWVKGYSNGL